MLYDNLVLVALVAIFATGNSEPNRSKWFPLECQANGVYAPNSNLMGDVKRCGDDKCAYHCQAIVLGLLNEDRSTSLKIYDEFTDAVFPTHYNQFAKGFFRDCYEKYGQHIDLQDKTCAMSKEYGDCTWGIVPHLKCDPNSRAIYTPWKYVRIF